MATHRVKRGETAKKLIVTLKHTNPVSGKIEPYSIPDGSTVQIYVTLDGEDDFVINGANLTPLVQANYPGKAERLWLGPDIDTPGDYDIEIVVTLPDLTKLKWPCEEGETFATVIVMPSKTA